VAKVWLVRHAPTTLSGICYGQSDVPVDPGPVEAAQLIARQWQQSHPSNAPELWSSPWVRALSVARELGKHWRVPWQVDARLSELAFGVWEGRQYTEIAAQDAVRWQHWALNYELEAPPQGETAAELRRRATAWLDERRSSESTVLAITHAGVVRTLRAVIRGLPYSSVAGDSVPHLTLEQLL
jgi:alpha-ribazole phosphatase